MNKVETKQTKKEKSKEVKITKKIIRKRLKYCQEQNGLSSCKNCGLNEKDLIQQEK